MIDQHKVAHYREVEGNFVFISLPEVMESISEHRFRSHAFVYQLDSGLYFVYISPAHECALI